MVLPRSIRDNLRFLIVEVNSQIESLEAYIQTRNVSIARRILDRSGYAYNLKVRIQNSCVKEISEAASKAKVKLRAVEVVAGELESITELCRDCVHQIGYLSPRQRMDKQAHRLMLKKVRRGIGMIEEALRENSTRRALDIGQIEQKLDRAYKQVLNRYTGQRGKSKQLKDVVGILFVAHAMEQMGDCLQEISEAIISASLGQPIDIDRYHTLMESIEHFGEGQRDLVMEPIAETRSGSGISGIGSSKSNGGGYAAIFKDGKKKKLKEELQGVESWHEIFPGLAPKILSYKKKGQSAALLIEHLAGLTFEQIVLNEPDDMVAAALRKLGSTLRSVWKETRTNQSTSARFMGQLAQRIRDVYSIHPEFEQGRARVGDSTIPSFDELVRRAERYEARFEAPFAVYIHGDFNVDNVIYDPIENKINYIDLHRSRYMDYVQDVSVFMVSNYRLQIMDAPVRRRIMVVIRNFYEIARRFAKKQGDETFEVRLALGLARSFATSTRFILDKSLAQSMFLRSRYLIEQVLDADSRGKKTYRVPIEEIFVG
jgi:aminoglycoside phosphotransferase (APT) family kinase protein